MPYRDFWYDKPPLSALYYLLIGGATDKYMRYALPLFPVVALGVLFQILTRGTHPAWMVMLIHLLFLFLAAMVCHGRLAAERQRAAPQAPQPRQRPEKWLAAIGRERRAASLPRGTETGR